MKKIYFLLIGICFLNVVSAQIINIPDANFKAKLLSSNENSFVAVDVIGNKIRIDINNNNEIEINEALLVSGLNIDSANISNLTGLENFINLKTLQCLGNLVTDLDASKLSNLKALYCYNNRLLSINVVGLENLETLEIGNNPLSELNLNGLKRLKTLNCYSCNLINLNLDGLSNLEFLNCINNQLININTSGTINLKDIRCENNKLGSVNISECINLEVFDCNNNQIESLNMNGLVHMTTLICNDNQLTTISLIGLSNIFYLKCFNNNIQSLDLTPLKNLVYLYCNNNKLTSLDLAGLSKLLFIHCEENQLTTLDLSSVAYIYDLFCANNKLVSLNLKNGSSDSQLLFGQNPDLKFICIDESQTEYVTFLLNSFGIKNCVINSYCSFTPGGIYYTTQGNSKLDIDNNGCDNNDFKYSTLNLKITDGIHSGNFISDTLGNYSIPVQEGTHTITPILENPTYFSVSPSSVNVSFPSQTNPFVQDFCITPNGIHNDLEVNILPISPARPGFDATYKIIYKNKGTSVQSGSVSLSFNDAVLDYITAVPVANSQVKDKLTWDYTNLQPLESHEITVTLNVNSPMETPAVNNGDRLSFNALITPVTGDEKPVDNAAALRQSVVGSFDPNDKTCLEGDVITPSLIGEYVNYLIRFENTGTYPAENIVVKDMIDLSKFDISTLVPTKASHDFVTKISDGNKVEFIFEKIKLPFDDANNDGYIAFKIKTLPTLAVGDSFENEANIYFDYNFPILTNKAKSTFKTLGTQDFEFSNYFSLYPNPANDILNIGMKNSIEVESMAVYDILGQLVIAVPGAQKVSKIDVSKLITGNYFLKIKTDKGSSTVKFIKN
jgi:hypothetical protein